MAKECPYCCSLIDERASKCPHCREYLYRAHDINDVPYSRTIEDRVIIKEKSSPDFVLVPLWSPGVAGILSFIIPGLGQIYRGKVMIGITWLVFTLLGYICFIIPGMILHLINIVCAASGNRYADPYTGIIPH